MKKIGVILATFFISISVLVGFFQITDTYPIPSDALVGLYHPYRDFFVNEYPNGIPFKNFLLTDPVRQQYPFRFLAISEILSFHIPLWNPYTLSGTPLLASVQSAPLYPLNLLFFALPFLDAWSLLIVLQPLLMGLFMYLYVRNLKVSHLAAVFGGVTFALSGFSIAWMEWNTIGHTALWLPLILLSIDHICVRDHSGTKNNYTFLLFGRKYIFSKSLFWFLVLLFSLCFALFAGHLQTFVYLFSLSVLYGLLRINRASQRISLALSFFSLLIIFVLGTVILWAPTIQFLVNSAREVDLTGYTSEGWFIPFEHLLQFLVPDFFGNPATLNYWGTWNYGELVGYVGIIPLFMAVYAIVFLRRKIIVFFTAIMIISILFATKNTISLLPFEFGIPFFSTAQPTRLLFLVDFSLAVLCSFGVQLFQTSYKKYWLILLGASPLFIGVWFSLFFHHNLFDIGAENIAVAKRNSILPTFLFVIMCVGYILTVIVKKKRFTLLMLLLFFVLTIFDLTRFAQKFLPLSSRDYVYPQTETISYLKNDRSLFRIMTTDDRILPPNVSMMYTIQTIDGYDPLYLRRYGELIAASERGAPDISPPFGFNRIISPKDYNSPIIDLLGVRYVLSLSEIDSDSFKKVFEEGQTKIYQNVNSFERAFFVEQIIIAYTKEEAITRMFDKNTDLRKTAIVESHETIINQQTFTIGEAMIKTYESNKVSIQTKNAEDGFLVLTDSYYPTWKAKIDGVEVEVFRTDYNFRGVFVPKGEHTVEFNNTLFGL